MIGLKSLASMAAIASTALFTAAPALSDGVPRAAAPSAPAAAAPMEIPSLTSWSGPYVGADAGYTSGDVNGVFDSDGAHAPLNTLSTDGELYGAHLGYNFQTGNFVIGIEGDYTKVHGDDSLIDEEHDAQSVDLDDLASIRGTIGYSFGKVLVYATAGYGFADFELIVENGRPDSHRIARVEFDEEGAVYGAGLAFAIAPNVSLRAEYLRYDVGTRFNIADDDVSKISDADDGDFVEFDDIDVIRAGLTIHLGDLRREEAPLK